MAQKLKFGNGTWATKEGSTLAYNDENNNYKPLPFTTTRDSIATRVNKEGLIEVVGRDVPRIDYTDSSEGALLLEPQKVNQMINSEDLTGWTIQAGATVTLESINNPVNSTNANLITVNTNGVYYNRNTPDVSALYSVSFWLHKNNQNGTIEFTNAQGGTVGKWTINLDLLQNDFVRITRDHSSVTVVTEFATLASGEIAPFFKSPTGTKSFYVTGFQLEEGSYPTSYIPTNGSTVQRQADTASGSGNSEVFNSEQGVLFANILPSTFTDVAPNFYKFISLSDGTPTNRLLLGITSSSKLSITMVTSGGNTAFTEKTISQQNLKVAINWDANYLTAYLNGFQYSTPLSVVSNFAANSLKSLNFNTPTSYPFYGKTKELGYYDTALTDEELEYMTSYRSLNELVTELNLNEL